MFPSIDRGLACILSLSLCFMLLFTADGTMGNIQKIVTSSISDDNPDFYVDGYTVIGVVYAMFAVSLWFGPYISYALGPKLTLIISSLGYLVSFCPYILEYGWGVYVAAVVNGIAAGWLWPAQGLYMIENSMPQTMTRNASIFWTIFGTSSLWGNLFVYYKFHGKMYLDRHTRQAVLYVLLVINLIAVAAFAALPKSASDQKLVPRDLITTLKKCWNIFTSYKMCWLLFIAGYIGLEQSFTEGIHSSCIGFTLAFKNSAKELVALSGIVAAIGGIIGAACLTIFANWIKSVIYARRLIFLIGCILQMIAYITDYINLPNAAVFGDTEEISVITPSAILAMTSSLLLKFGDSCVNIQMFSIIADLYRENCAEACALLTFVRSIFVAVSFFGISLIGLHIQLVILTTTAVIGVSCFFIAEYNLPESVQQLQTCSKSQTKNGKY